MVAGSDVMVAGSDVMVAGSDVMVAGSDVMVAGSDVMVAGSARVGTPTPDKSAAPSNDPATEAATSAVLVNRCRRAITAATAIRAKARATAT